MSVCSDTRQGRGLSLLVAHGASLGLETPTARERLDVALGPELAQKLVFALCAGGPFRLERFAV